jgi:hypothetical protein
MKIVVDKSAVVAVVVGVVEVVVVVDGDDTYGKHNVSWDMIRPERKLSLSANAKILIDRWNTRQNSSQNAMSPALRRIGGGGESAVDENDGCKGDNVGDVSIDVAVGGVVGSDLILFHGFSFSISS